MAKGTASETHPLDPDTPGAATQAPGLPCFLVYSDVSHCPDMNMFLTIARPVLADAGYSPVELGDEIRSSEDYLMNLDRLVGDSVLGVVFLDGMRPNVPYELGHLRGLGKPVIVLQSKAAEFCVKTLYTGDSEANLGMKSFGDMHNPRLRVKDHFSDFGGKHIAFYDKTASDSEPEHLRNVLKDELVKARPLVESEMERLQQQSLPPDLLDKAEPVIAEVTRQHSADPAKVDLGVLRDALTKMEETVGPAGIPAPAGFLRTVALAAIRGYEGAGDDADRMIDALTLALLAYGRLLGVAADGRQKAEARFGLGYTHDELALYRDRPENCRKAIAAYEQALSVYTRDRFPMDFAMTQNNLGNAYRTLAEVEEKPENCRKAIAAYEQALSVYTRDRFPIQYATTQNNLGTAYSTLAEVEEKPENCRKAIAALKKSVRVYKLQGCGVPLAIAERNLASTKAFCGGGRKKR